MARADYRIPGPTGRQMNPNLGGPDIGTGSPLGEISTDHPRRNEGFNNDTLARASATPPTSSGPSHDGNQNG